MIPERETPEVSLRGQSSSSQSSLNDGTDIDLGDAALTYARRGWWVFPLRPGAKEPFAGSRGFYDATTSAAQIKEWWTMSRRANIGIACGPSDLIIVDVDGSKGRRSLKQLERDGYCFPPTMTAWAARGPHFYFQRRGLPLGSTAEKLGPGIDTRGIGGYIVAAPSLHPSGKRYKWLTYDAAVAPVPEWLADRLTPRTAPTPSQRLTPAPGDLTDAYIAAALQGEASVVAAATPGGRNHALNRSAYALARLPVNEAEIYAALELAAAACGLSSSEARRTIASAIRARRSTQ